MMDGRILRCMLLLEVRFDCHVIALWGQRCKVTFEARP